MFDPFFGIGVLGTPFALIFLFLEARRNATTVPSIGTCLVALFAAYGVHLWIMMLTVSFLGRELQDSELTQLDAGAGIVAALLVGGPFFISARRRWQRASSNR